MIGQNHSFSWTTCTSPDLYQPLNGDYLIFLPSVSFPLVGALRLSALHHPHKSHCKSHHMYGSLFSLPAVLHKFLAGREQSFSLPHPGLLSILRAVSKPNLSPGHTFTIKSSFKLPHISIDVSTTSKQAHLEISWVLGVVMT